MENEAQSRHELILNDRLKDQEESWKTEAETRHAVIVHDLKLQLDHTTSALCQSLQKISALEDQLKERDAKLDHAETLLHRLREANRQQQKNFND